LESTLLCPFRGKVALAGAEGCSISASGARGGYQPGDCWRVNSRTRATAAAEQGVRGRCRCARGGLATNRLRDAIALDSASGQLV
jgi:hypothetical protein